MFLYFSYSTYSTYCLVCSVVFSEGGLYKYVHLLPISLFLHIFIVPCFTFSCFLCHHTARLVFPSFFLSFFFCFSLELRLISASHVLSSSSLLWLPVSVQALCTCVSSSPTAFGTGAPALSLALSFCCCHVIYSLVSVTFPLPSSAAVLPRDRCHFGWIAFLGRDLLFPTAWLLRLRADLIASTVFNLLSPSQSLYCWPHPLLSWIIKIVFLMPCCTTQINKQTRRKMKTEFSCLQVKVDSSTDRHVSF